MGGTPKPFFSVIIPTHDRVEMLGRAVASVTGQSCGDYEIVVMDDASRPPVPAEPYRTLIAAGVMKLLRSDEPSGASQARNAAIDAAVGEYVVFLDDDDTLVETCLEKVKEKILGARRPDVVCMSRKLVFHGIDGVRGHEIQNAPRPPPDVDDRDTWIGESVAMSWGNPGIVVRRECFLAVGMFDPELRRDEDIDLFLRLLRAGAVWETVPECLTNVHFHAGGRLTTSDELRARAQSYEKMIDKNLDIILASPRLSEFFGRELVTMLYRTGRNAEARRLLRQFLGARVFYPCYMKRVIKCEIGYPLRRLLQRCGLVKKRSY